MRLLSLLLLSMLPYRAVASDSPVFDDSFPKFKDPSGTIVWAASTNDWPATLWVYKVIPQKFSSEAISNLTAMGSFTAAQRLPGTVIRFSTKDYSRYLIIDTNGGCVNYFNAEAEARMSGKLTHRPEPVEGLPGREETESLALKFARLFGIQRSELVTKPGTSNLLTFGEMKKRSYLDKTRKVYVDDEAFTRGVFLNRRIDGVNFAGIGVGGGLEVEFGNHSQVTKLSLIWRNLQHYKQYKVANAAELIRRIQDGRAVLTHKNMINPSEVKKLIITDARPLYMGSLEFQDFVYPFAEIDATAELENTNIDIQLHCPIIVTAE